MENQYQAFFKPSEYNFIDVEFDFDKLAQVTSPEFAKEIKEATNYNYIKKMDISNNTYTFYVEDMRGNFKCLITAFFSNTYNHFTVDFIPAYILERMGLTLKKGEKNNEISSTANA